MRGREGRREESIGENRRNVVWEVRDCRGWEGTTETGRDRHRGGRKAILHSRVGMGGREKSKGGQRARHKGTTKTVRQTMERYESNISLQDLASLEASALFTFIHY